MTGAGGVAVAAAPSAPAGGLEPVAAGAAAPLPDSAPGIGLSSAITVLNYHHLHDTEIVQADEIWRSDNGQAVITPFGADYSLINYGLIQSIGTADGGAKCISLGSIDRIENYGTMRAIGSGVFSATVIANIGSFGTLSNHGLIEAIAEQGRALGVNIGMSFWGMTSISRITARSSPGTTARTRPSARRWSGPMPPSTMARSSRPAATGPSAFTSASSACSRTGARSKAISRPGPRGQR